MAPRRCLSIFLEASLAPVPASAPPPDLLVCGFPVLRVVALLLATAAAQAHPNIVLAMADDQGWGETGYNGHPDLRTPVLDEMAASGLRFDRFYAAAPNCSPTRAAILTGRHPNRSGVFAPNHTIRPEEITLAQILREAGLPHGAFREVACRRRQGRLAD